MSPYFSMAQKHGHWQKNWKETWWPVYSSINEGSKFNMETTSNPWTNIWQATPFIHSCPIKKSSVCWTLSQSQKWSYIITSALDTIAKKSERQKTFFSWCHLRDTGINRQDLGVIWRIISSSVETISSSKLISSGWFESRKL